MLVELGQVAAVTNANFTIVTPAILGATRNTGRAKFNAAIRLYESDQVVEAQTVALQAGAGDHGEYAGDIQVIDAEARTSRDSMIARTSGWMEVEQIPREQPMVPERIAEVAEAAIRKVWATIGLRPGVDTMVTLLARDVVLPANFESTGYVTAKKSFAKYCLPGSFADDPNLMGLAIQGLAACHAAALISNSVAPPWLIAATEAITDIQVSDNVRHGFCVGATKWREPGLLNVRLLGLQLGGNPVESAGYSLSQAILIGRYLIEEQGIKTFRDLLAYHSPTSIFHYMSILFSKDPTRDACKRLYEFAPEYLFEQALARCCK